MRVCVCSRERERERERIWLEKTVITCTCILKIDALNSNVKVRGLQAKKGVFHTRKHHHGYLVPTCTCTTCTFTPISVHAPGYCQSVITPCSPWM